MLESLFIFYDYCFFYLHFFYFIYIYLTVGSSLTAGCVPQPIYSRLAANAEGFVVDLKAVFVLFFPSGILTHTHT